MVKKITKNKEKSIKKSSNLIERLHSKKTIVKQPKKYTYKKVLKITFGDLALLRGVSRRTVQQDRYNGKFSFDDILSVARYVLRIK